MSSRCAGKNAAMKKLVATFFALSTLVAAPSAIAADLSVAPLYKAPPPQVSPIYNWTGFYAGVNGGGGWGRSWWQSQATSIDLSGAQLGGTVKSAWTASPPPLKTTSASFGNFSRILNNSSSSCGVVPIGGVAQLYFSGLARASATKSLMVFAGDSALTTNVLGVVASSLTPTKSL